MMSKEHNTSTPETRPGIIFGPGKATILVDKEPYADGESVFTNDRMEIGCGITVLVGCNGNGKTTMLDQIADATGWSNSKDLYAALSMMFHNENDYQDDESIARCDTIYWKSCAERDDALGNAISNRGLLNLSEAGNIMGSSEGEGISIAAGALAQQLGQSALSGSSEPLVVLVDSIDSGLDDASIADVIDVLSLASNDFKKAGRDCFIIVTANSFGVVNAVQRNGGKCIDSRTFEKKHFTSYDDYYEFVSETRRMKYERYAEYSS